MSLRTLNRKPQSCILELDGVPEGGKKVRGRQLFISIMVRHVHIKNIQEIQRCIMHNCSASTCTHTYDEVGKNKLNISTEYLMEDCMITSN